MDLSKWREVPKLLMIVGGVLALVGLAVNRVQFGYSWLLAYMLFLSLCLGALFLVLVHHLFDASWSVPIRRINEHLAGLLPWMAILFIPIAILAENIYPWIHMLKSGATDHALHSKLPLFTVPGFYAVAVINFALWWFFSARLRFWSL